MSERLERVDVVCGGFPCQDISLAGDGAGLAGERSGLWRPMAHTIRVVRPQYAVVENVAALLHRGMGEVLGDLADIGYDAQWDCLSACAYGAPHMRQRVFIVAHTNSEHGRPRLRDSVAQAFRPLQSIDGFESARAGYQERLANPSALYGDADGAAFGLDRNRGIGNSVYADCAEWIGKRIIEAEEALTVDQAGRED